VSGPRGAAELVERTLAGAIARLMGERYVAAIVAGDVTGDVRDPSLTPLQQLIDDVSRVVEEVERHVDKSFESDYWRSDLLDSVESVRRVVNAWRELVQAARDTRP
jgi:hypothetical protein